MPRPRPPIRRRKTPRPPRWWRGRRLTAYGREAVSVLVLVGTIFLRDKPALPVAKREEEVPPGVWAVDLRGAEAWWGLSAAARKVPAKPFPEQKAPPCLPRLEEALSGGCWLVLAATAPCPGDTFEHAGRCFIPVRVTERLPTSLGE